MNFGPVGIWEIVIIVGLALLIFGPSQLPKLARGAGKTVKTVREGVQDVKDELTGAVVDKEEAARAERRKAAALAEESRADAGQANSRASAAPNKTQEPGAAAENDAARVAVTAAEDDDERTLN